jgi:hypothetical protein
MGIELTVDAMDLASGAASGYCRFDHRDPPADDRRGTSAPGGCLRRLGRTANKDPRGSSCSPVQEYSSFPPSSKDVFQGMDRPRPYPRSCSRRSPADRPPAAPSRPPPSADRRSAIAGTPHRHARPSSRSLRPSDKCALASRTCNRTPAGVTCPSTFSTARPN